MRFMYLCAQTMYPGEKTGTVRATFECVNAIGWKPGPKLPKPAKRGSQTASLGDIGKVTKSHK